MPKGPSQQCWPWGRENQVHNPLTETSSLLQQEFWPMEEATLNWPTYPHVRSPLTELGSRCRYKASQIAKVLCDQIQHYRCHLSKNTVTTGTRYNFSKWLTTRTDGNPGVQGQQATSPAPIGLTQTSLKDCMADDTDRPTFPEGPQARLNAKGVCWLC